MVIKIKLITLMHAESSNFGGSSNAQRAYPLEHGGESTHTSHKCWRRRKQLEQKDAIQLDLIENHRKQRDINQTKQVVNGFFGSQTRYKANQTAFLPLQSTTWHIRHRSEY